MLCNGVSAIRIEILAPASTRATLPEAYYACESEEGVSPAPPRPPGWTCYDGVPPVALLNVSEAYWRHTLVLPRGDGYDNDGDGQDNDVRNRAGTSAASDVPPTVGGQLGNLGTPAIVQFFVDDPNNGDTRYGEGDVLTIVLDRPVDRTDVFGDRESVDRLFGFTTPLGDSYRGQWNDTSTFVILVEDATDAGPVERGATRVHASTRRRCRSNAGPPIGSLLTLPSRVQASTACHCAIALAARALQKLHASCNTCLRHRALLATLACYPTRRGSSLPPFRTMTTLTLFTQPTTPSQCALTGLPTWQAARNTVVVCGLTPCLTSRRL